MSKPYVASDSRYEKMTYNRVGSSGLLFPAVSLGFWHNFGSTKDLDSMRELCRTAFDLGITQFDLANNYGPPYGRAEENLGKILKEDFAPYRDELVITTKAGYDMWPGPYGNWGSKKYLTASIGQSLARMALSWVLRDGKVCSVLIGASSPAQIRENVSIAGRTDFTEEELDEIDQICFNG